VAPPWRSNGAAKTSAAVDRSGPAVEARDQPPGESVNDHVQGGLVAFASHGPGRCSAGGQKVAGSNPVAPTSGNRRKRGGFFVLEPGGSAPAGNNLGNNSCQDHVRQGSTATGGASAHKRYGNAGQVAPRRASSTSGSWLWSRRSRVRVPSLTLLLKAEKVVCLAHRVATLALSDTEPSPPNSRREAARVEHAVSVALEATGTRTRTGSLRARFQRQSAPSQACARGVSVLFTLHSALRFIADGVVVHWPTSLTSRSGSARADSWRPAPPRSLPSWIRPSLGRARATAADPLSRLHVELGRRGQDALYQLPH
jgi:hypothetical protein